MASKIMTRSFADGTKKTFIRKKQGRNNSRNTIKFLLRLPVEYHAMMSWINNSCGGNMPITQQINDSIRASLCGYVYTQLVKH